jgi:hypothetical protein
MSGPRALTRYDTSLKPPRLSSKSRQAAATLALRDGKAEATGFCLANQRVRVGDLAICQLVHVRSGGYWLIEGPLGLVSSSPAACSPQIWLFRATSHI